MAFKHKFQWLFGLALLSLQASRGADVFQSMDDLPEGVNYDFIIAGGGTGGSLVATRLAQNPNWKVLVIEAGISNEDFWETRVPAFWPLLWNTRMDWNFTTVPQTGLNNRAVNYPRAKILGGCSSHNAMIYTRGSKSEWDQYAQLGGNAALKWNTILPLLMKAEKWTRDAQALSDSGHYNPAFHGKTGQLSVQAPYMQHPFNNLLIQASQELHSEFPFNLDWNDGTPIGTAWNQFTIDSMAQRSSAATAFLSHTSDNVHILLNTQVTRVLPTAANSTDFRKVEFGPDATSLKQLTAKKEVIVSGGIFGTPSILLHSGIGDRTELQAAGVPAIIHNPSVGKNLSDQVTVFVFFLPVVRKLNIRAIAMIKPRRSMNGTPHKPVPSRRLSPLNHMSFIRLPANAPPFSQEGFPDPTAGSDAAHVEFTFFQVGAPDPANGVDNSTLQIYLSNVHPTSRGSVTISSSNPFDYPAIDPGILGETADMSILREGFRSLRRYLSAPAFQGVIYGSVVPPANATSDEDLEAFLRSSASSWLHGVGSATMSPHGASWGVVDPDFRVKGTTGLRVVDASVIPRSPSAHTQAPTYGFAELASLMIAAQYH
ncbi:hypothetical protein NP233_g8801 [Leucocoprinus birnbaumii]|uniref:pyranose dehydrogenase (acceptor) n=1 Tax=Leucocoprinus birnbaumii TaxID=56174 RepID=A0AAD5VM93_9AGAR|nr:hypothetical protein NP233_g8801 [Leucocoprinus birnbaumii]